MDDVINLVSATYTKNEYGVPVAHETKREVYADVRSVTRAEFFEGGRSGLNPRFHFNVFHGDYNGEEIAEYQGLRYGVYRVYRNESDYIELYVERKGGTNGETDHD